MSALPSPRWYAVNTRPRSEKIAVTNLERQGFRFFLPNCIKIIRHARQYRSATVPLFPGYLFVALDLTRDRWRSVNGTIGVVSLVMTGGEPRPVPCGVVEALQEMAREGNIVRFDRDLKPGQRVKLLVGAFTEQIGMLESLDDQGRVRVLLNMMGGSVRVTTTTEFLAPA